MASGRPAGIGPGPARGSDAIGAVGQREADGLGAEALQQNGRFADATVHLGGGVTGVIEEDTEGATLPLTPAYGVGDDPGRGSCPGGARTRGRAGRRGLAAPRGLSRRCPGAAAEAVGTAAGATAGRPGLSPKAGATATRAKPGGGAQPTPYRLVQRRSISATDRLDHAAAIINLHWGKGEVEERWAKSVGHSSVALASFQAPAPPSRSLLASNVGTERIPARLAASLCRSISTVKKRPEPGPYPAASWTYAAWTTRQGPHQLAVLREGGRGGRRR